MASWDFVQKQILLGDASTGKSSLLVRLTDNRFLQHSEPTIGVEFGSRLVELLEGRDVGKKVKLQIWDTAGQESFRSITRSYYRGAGGALLVFDITNRASYLSCRSWLSDLRAWGEEDLVILLVGNKGDLCATDVEVEDETEPSDADKDEDDLEDDATVKASNDDVPSNPTSSSNSTPATSSYAKATTSTDAKAPKRQISIKEAEGWATEEGLAGYVETSAKLGTGVEEAFNSLTRTVHERYQASLLANRRAGASNGGSSFPLSMPGATKAGCC